MSSSLKVKFTPEAPKHGQEVTLLAVRLFAFRAKQRADYRQSYREGEHIPSTNESVISMVSDPPDISCASTNRFYAALRAR